MSDSTFIFLVQKNGLDVKVLAELNRFLPYERKRANLCKKYNTDILLSNEI